MKRRIWDLFDWKKKGDKITTDYEEDDLSLEKSSIPPTRTFSLNPEKEYSENNIETEGVAFLADSFKEEEGVEPLLKKLADWVSDLWVGYNQNAHGILTQATDRLRQSITPIQEESVIDNLRSRVRLILTRKANLLAEVQKLLAQARADLRALTIGVFGSPVRVVMLADPKTEMVVSVAIMSAAIALEFFVNFGVVQWATDDKTSGAFSLIAGVVASVAAHFAADARRQIFAYADAITENNRWSAEVKGVDPATGKRPSKPFPLPAGLSFQSKLSHSLWIGLCVGILFIRGAIVAQRENWGDLAGSFGFVAIVGAYYLFKVTRKGAHARVDEYSEKKKEIKEYEKELKTIGDPVAEDSHTKEIMAAFSEYKEAVSTKKLTEAIAKAKAELIRLRDEAEGAREFFLGVLQRSAGSLCKSIERLHEELVDPSEEEIKGMLVPPDPLAHANPAINEALSETEKPMTQTSAINMHSLIGEIWAGVLQEQRRITIEEAQQAKAIRKEDARGRIEGFRPTKKER